MRADLLDRLLVTLSVRLRAFSICRIQHGWRLKLRCFRRRHDSLCPARNRQPARRRRAMAAVRAAQHHRRSGPPLACDGRSRGHDRERLAPKIIVHCMAMGWSPSGQAMARPIRSWSAARSRPATREPWACSSCSRLPWWRVSRRDSALHASFEAMMAEVATPSLGTQAMTELLMKQCLIVLLRRQLLSHDDRSPDAEGACRSRSSLAPSWRFSKIRLLPTRSRAWRHSPE